MRALSESFINDLKKPNGILNPVLTRIRKDHTLMLAIRDDTINIYYRGGNILKIEKRTKSVYRTSFDDSYSKFGQSPTGLNNDIGTVKDAQRIVDSLSIRKNIMDEFFSDNNKSEREFQQLVARENNYSSISNESEYFVMDIEAADSNSSGRIDILAVRWLATQRRSGNHCKAALIEMKYGDEALRGDAGLSKHLKDMDALIADKDRFTNLIDNMESQFNQLDQLGLLKFNKGKSKARVNLSVDEKPEVIFILANHNPRSTKLKTILNSPEMDIYEKSGRFDLRFFMSSFAGYGMHADCMLTLSEIRSRLKGLE